MKTKYLLPLLAALLCATACTKTPQEDTNQTCIVVYTVDSQEKRAVVKNDSEWESLMDQFCDFAVEGKSVTFYNLNSQPQNAHASKGRPTVVKEASTITTSDRNEMKRWMRRMEQSGKTVNVTYDRQTGVWSGTAYAVAPSVQDSTVYQGYTGILIATNFSDLIGSQLSTDQFLALRCEGDTTLVIVRDSYLLAAGSTLDGHTVGDTVTLYGTVTTLNDSEENSILILNLITPNTTTPIGTWMFSSLTEYRYSNSGEYLLDIAQYLPEESGRPIFFRFNTDGTAARIVGNNSIQPQYGSWSVEDNIFHCNLEDLDQGEWEIVWLTSNSMILNRTTTDNLNQDVIQQIVLKKKIEKSPEAE